jgi:hypothetical protein
MGRAIEILASDPERVRRMGARARRTIEERRYYWLDNARRALLAVGLQPGAADGADRVAVEAVAPQR